MKWWETLGIIVTFIVFWQGINWVLNSVGLSDSIGDILTFLISIIFTSLIVIVLIQIQQYNEIKSIKKKMNIKDKKTFIEKILKKNKRGAMIDPKILFWILLAILLYLFLKAIGIIN